MRSAAAVPTLLAMGVLAAPGPAQGQTNQLIDCRTLFQELEARWPEPARASASAGERFVRLCTAGLRLGGATAASSVRSLNNGQILLLRGTREQVAPFEQAASRLRKSEFARFRLQCTVLRVPAAAVVPFGLANDRAKPATFAEAGKLFKLARQDGSSLLNLPEVAAVTLQPFCAELPVRPPGKGEAPPPAHPLAGLRVRGEGMVTEDDTVLFDLQVFEGARPADLTAVPGNALVDVPVQLEAGEGVLLAHAARGQATVVWCQLVALEPAPKEK